MPDSSAAATVGAAGAATSVGAAAAAVVFVAAAGWLVGAGTSMGGAGGMAAAGLAPGESAGVAVGAASLPQAATQTRISTSSSPFASDNRTRIETLLSIHQLSTIDYRPRLRAQ